MDNFVPLVGMVLTEDNKKKLQAYIDRRNSLGLSTHINPQILTCDYNVQRLRIHTTTDEYGVEVIASLSFG